jgi:hypothetical protein
MLLCWVYIWREGNKFGGENMEKKICFACRRSEKEITHKLLWRMSDNVDYLCDDCTEYFQKHHPNALVEKIEN